MPQCEDGYTRVANELLEALCRTRIPGESMQIFLVILRKTYGFGKKSDRIALSQFVELSGIVKTHVSRAVAKLESMNMVVTQNGNKVTQNGNRYNLTYEINKHYDTWKLLPKKVTLPKVVTSITQKGNDVTQNGNKGYPKRVLQKKERNLTKETITKEKDLLEICIAWKAYVEMRKTIKKPMTEYAKRLRVEDLFKLMRDGEDPIAVLNQSTASNYQDLYPVKEKNNGTKPAGNKPRSKQGFIEANGTGTDFLS